MTSKPCEPGEPEQEAQPSKPHPTSAGYITSWSKRAKARSLTACHYCRERKVRCTQLEHGAPCMRCRLDDVDCVITERNPPRKHTNVLKRRLGTQWSTVDEPSKPSLNSSAGAAAPINCIIEPFHSNRPVCRTLEVYDTEKDKTVESNGLEYDLGTHGQHSGFYWQTELNTTASILADSDLIPAHSLSLLRTPDWCLPWFLQPIPAHMMGHDLDYLRERGAFSIPETPLLNELLRSYAEYVHPTMPAVELNSLLRMINQKEGEATSLILFQAMMFTASAFVDEKYLSAAGYTSRGAAQRELFQKAKLLYEFDYERDRFCLVQCLLLLTYWHESPYDQKDMRHWLNIAISLAYTIGLHRNQTGSVLSVKARRLWKRVWWCCYMRDRLVAFATKGIVRISDEDFNVQMLTADDFGTDYFPSYNTTVSLGCSVSHDEQTQRDVAALFIVKAKLCFCISHFLRAEYSVLCSGRAKAQRQETNLGSTPTQRSQGWICEANSLDAELMDWARNLPSECRDQTISFDDIENGRSCVVIQRALLHMLYFAVASAVHKSHGLQALEMPVDALAQGIFPSAPCKTLRIASHEITRISMDLISLKLEPYLPTSSLTSLLYAIKVHLLDARSPNDFLRQRATQGLEHCMTVLESLRTKSASADRACRILQLQIMSAHISKSNI